MISVQCDACCPPSIATNPEPNLHRAGWQLTSRGAQYDTCPTCSRAKHQPRRGEVDARPEAQGGRLPNLLIIGAAKCGTTSLHAYLDTHPDVFMAPWKELRFFQDPGYLSWLPAYKAQFDTAAKIAGESSTMYTRAPALPGTAKRMAHLVPDARLIYMVRDPVQRAIASYLEERFQLLDQRSAVEAFADLDDPYNPYVSASKYAEQLESYFEYFSADQVLVVSLADLETQPRRALERIFRFLQVDPAHRVDTSARYNQGTQKYEYLGIGRWLRHSPLGRAVRRIPPGARTAFISPAKRLFSRPMENPELPADFQRALTAELAPDAMRFREITGQAFTDWSV